MADARGHMDRPRTGLFSTNEFVDGVLKLAGKKQVARTADPHPEKYGRSNVTISFSPRGVHALATGPIQESTILNRGACHGVPGA
jgi:hypothetical protein